jgi:hypothetical protein
MRAPRGGPLPAAMYGGYKCYNPCLRLATGAPWYVTGRYEDLGVPLFADHIRTLTARTPLVRQLGSYLR